MVGNPGVKAWTLAAALLAVLVTALVMLTGGGIGTARAQDPTIPVLWQLEVQGVGSGYFREVEGLETALKVVQVKVDGSKLAAKKAGRGSASNIVLRRGLTDDMSFHEWHRQVIANGTSGSRKNGSITVFDETNAPVARFEFTNGWPSKYGVQHESDIVIEEVTLAVDDLRRVD